MRKESFVLLTSLFAAPLAAFASSPTATLELRITNVAPGGGRVYVGLFEAGSSFPDASATQSAQTVEPAAETVQVTFEGLRPGRYAVAVYQDANHNGELDRSWIGRPQEPYGFSNNVRPRLGPPSFEDATLVLEARTRTLVKLLRP